MKSSRAASAAFLAVFTATAGYACSSGDRPLATGSETGSPDAMAFDAGRARGTADAGSKDAAADATPADAASDSATAEAGTDRDTGANADADADAGADVGGGGFPQPPAALCRTNAIWGVGTLLPVSAGSSNVLDAITPDELTMAWTSGTGGTATLYYADRATSAAVFGAPTALAAGAFAVDRAALSPDGLRLVVVSADGQAFLEATRASRTAPGNAFGAPAAGTYANLDVAGVLGADQSYGDPVLSADDHFFYYSVFGSGLTATVYSTARIFGSDPWPSGSPVTSTSALQAQGARRRRPTGVSSDGQTLFFWDEVTAIERAAWINESTGSFDLFMDLGARSMAAPDTACDRLYYSAQGASSEDLFVAAAGP
jgi:hypothetical protein